MSGHDPDGGMPGWVRLMLVAALLVCVGAGVWLWTLATRSTRSLAATEEAIRKSGDPLDFAELLREPIPEERNAAVVYARAIKALKTEPEEEWEALCALVSWNGRRLSQAQWELVKQAVDRNDRAVKLVEEALSRPDCQFPADYSVPIAVVYPHLSGLRQLGQMLAARGIVARRRGAGDQAVESAILLLRMVAQLREDRPQTLISLLLRSQCYGLAVRDLIRGGSAGLTRDQCRSLMPELTQPDLHSDLAQALVVERCMWRSVYTSLMNGEGLTDILPEADGTDLGAAWWALKLPPVRWHLARDQQFYLELMGEYLESARQPGWDWETEKTLEARLEEAKRRYLLVTLTLAPTLARVQKHPAAAQSQLDLAALAVAIQLYHLEHHHRPDSLSELTPAYLDTLPRDPFTNKPYIYKPEPGRYVLYSAGPDRRDDGGKVGKNLLADGTDIAVHGQWG